LQRTSTQDLKNNTTRGKTRSRSRRPILYTRRRGVSTPAAGGPALDEHAEETGHPSCQLRASNAPRCDARRTRKCAETKQHEKRPTRIDPRRTREASRHKIGCVGFKSAQQLLGVKSDGVAKLPQETIQGWTSNATFRPSARHRPQGLGLNLERTGVRSVAPTASARAHTACVGKRFRAPD